MSEWDHDLLETVVRRTSSEATRTDASDMATLVAHDKALRAEIERLRAALEFYRDPFAWKRKNDPTDDIRVPDF